MSFVVSCKVKDLKPEITKAYSASFMPELLPVSAKVKDAFVNSRNWGLSLDEDDFQYEQDMYLWQVENGMA